MPLCRLFFLLLLFSFYFFFADFVTYRRKIFCERWNLKTLEHLEGIFSDSTAKGVFLAIFFLKNRTFTNVSSTFSLNTSSILTSRPFHLLWFKLRSVWWANSVFGFYISWNFRQRFLLFSTEFFHFKLSEVLRQILLADFVLSNRRSKTQSMCNTCLLNTGPGKYFFASRAMPSCFFCSNNAKSRNFLLLKCQFFPYLVPPSSQQLLQQPKEVSWFLDPFYGLFDIEKHFGTAEKLPRIWVFCQKKAVLFFKMPVFEAQLPLAAR